MAPRRVLRQDGGERGQVITVISNSNGSTTIQNSAGGINAVNMVIAISADILKESATGGNITMLLNEALTFYNNGTDWSMVGTRIVDATQ